MKLVLSSPFYRSCFEWKAVALALYQVGEGGL
uniref:Uncharacterized protein n=1 Tax=Utricularia reniformis TaxID=192314 RepID=A0A1Y0AZS6_9LAMI|nr:hypothetical protein AEK19_MT0367 [Utricularia reniformis]ART30639.1 hypothetical protein AEK19_MT0367 [Utricularia reniformis]